eukprot:TRINITY_DN32192_c0_g1_i1.p1 TRINITY_DN32192_c0_g1~~TRINITY_DN32192_c0_g1_i1.p1  ORF type:complete len:1043 (+),score=418.12 TRINITY_DN32192_c0_g1_i1:205-3129(+)
MGASPFCLQVIAVLVDGRFEAVVRQAAGMVLKQQLRHDEVTRADQQLVPMILKGLGADQPHEVVSVVSGIVLDILPIHKDALVGALLSLPRSFGVYESIAQMLELQEKGKPAHIDNSSTCAKLCMLIPEALEHLGRSEGVPLFVRLLRLLFAIPDEPEEDAPPSQDSTYHLQQRYAEPYLVALLSVKDKALVLGSLTDAMELWPACGDTNLETVVTRSYEIAFEALSTGSDEQRATACGFWSEAAGCDMFPPTLLLGYLPRLLPELVRALQWGDDVLQEEAFTNEDDAHVVEDENITHINVPSRNPEEQDEEEEEDDRAKLYERLVGASHLRTEADLCLQTLAESHPDALAPGVMQYLGSTNLDDSSNWKLREAIATLIGTTAEECIAFYAQQGAVDKILNLMNQSFIQNEPRGLVRDAALYCVGQMTTSIVQASNELDSDEEDDGPSTPHVPAVVPAMCLPVLVKHVADRNKRCQGTCIDALVEVAGQMHGSLDLTRTVVEAATSGTLQLTNRCRAFRAAARMMVPVVGQKDMQIPESVARYLHNVVQGAGPMLVRKVELPSVLYALLTAIRLCPEESAAAVTASCIAMCQTLVTATAQAATQFPGKDLGLDSVTVALDIISTLNDSFPAAFAQQAADVKQLLSGSLQLINTTSTEDASLHRREEMLHSCSSLVGDLAGSDFDMIADVALDLARFLADHLLGGVVRLNEDSGMSAAGNATWALGELVDRLPEQQCQALFAAAPGLQEKCVSMICDDAQYGCIAPPKFLSAKQNAACCLGRLGHRGLPLLRGSGTQDDARWVDRWCHAVWKLDDDTEEKRHATLGVARQAVQMAESPVSLTIHLCLAGLLACWRTEQTPEVAAVKKQLGSLLANAESRASAVPLQYQIPIVFRAADASRKGVWSLPTVNNVAAGIGDPVLTEAQWKGMCKELAASPSAGLSEKHVNKLYISPLGESRLAPTFSFAVKHLATTLG